MNLEPPHDVTHRQCSQRPIAPLPPEVVAQIKSSTAITSLATAILGLVENSLDSGATQVEIAVDARRGGCTVEDDGFGILPSEFKESGGLGKPYCTSKHDSSDSSRHITGSIAHTTLLLSTDPRSSLVKVPLLVSKSLAFVTMALASRIQSLFAFEMSRAAEA
ncbi:DNA mismatch repair protein MutL [Lasiodiplodia hormozganensis]|uniref:DNA mismatch repair protein MutL n=1 Tax=Lasiodiplodia hormozganensis TaxID=869390 RepID=A0AA39YL64_9PEZI|nr:DNA mismatch repair protein MutL [Lasiodiplodia hormozganensis]